MKNPSDITSNPISINKHLLESLIQQQTYSDIQPQEIATEFKTLVLKHRTLQMTKEGDKNHNEIKKMKSFVLIPLKVIQSCTYENSEYTQGI